MSIEDLRAPLHTARRAGLVALGCAQLSLAMSGKLAWAVCAVAIVATTAAVEWVPRRPPETDKLVRAGTTVVAMVASGAAVLSVVHSLRSGDPAEVIAPLRQALPLALVVIGSCHAATWRSLRDTQAGLVVAFGLVAMAAVFAGNIPAGLVAVLGGPAVLVGIRHARWQRALDEAPAAVVVSAAGVRASAGPPGSGPSGSGPGSGPLGSGPLGSGAESVRRRPGSAATVTAIAAALLLSLLLPFSAGTSALNRWSNRHSLPAGAVGSGAGAGGSTRDAGAASYTSGPLDLRMRGQLPSTPLLRVDNPGPYQLWRASIYARYTGGSVWLPAVAPAATTLPATGRVTSSSAPVVTFVEHRLERRDYSVYAPGDVLTLDAAGDPEVFDNGNGTMALGDGVSSYTVAASLIPTIGDATDPLGPPTDANAWTQLPATVPPRVRDLGLSLAAGASDPRDITRAIETYLRANERYTLDSPVPARDEDAVDMFLFRDHLGFCEQFATAETVLLRAAGVPSRLVSGLGYGHDNGGGGRDFLASDLHAWVEFWLPGTGWVSSDPTAGVPLATSSSASGAIRHAVENLLKKIPFGRLGVAVLLVLVAALVAYVVLRRRRRPGESPAFVAGAPIPYGPAADAYRRLQKRLAAQGRARLPQETVRDHALRTGADPELTRALLVVEDEVFAATAPPPDRSAAAAAHLDTQAPLSTAGRERITMRKALK